MFLGFNIKNSLIYLTLITAPIENNMVNMKGWEFPESESPLGAIKLFDGLSKYKINKKRWRIVVLLF